MAPERPVAMDYVQNALKGGVCASHGAKRKQCSHEGCTNVAQKGGVCWTHGAKVVAKICAAMKDATFKLKSLEYVKNTQRA